MPKTYSEKLKDPRWQKKRLEILKRDGFKCTECFGAERQLHVHHLFYRRSLDPWDYPDLAMITVCDECHEACARAAESLLMTVFGARNGIGCAGTALILSAQLKDVVEMEGWEMAILAISTNESFFNFAKSCGITGEVAV